MRILMQIYTKQTLLFFILAGLSVLSCILFLINSLYSHTFADSYLLTNLLLAWIPLIITYILIKSLHNNLWLTWKPLIISFLWLIFLPNSFYLVSDLIHIVNQNVGNILYVTVLFESFIVDGLLIGFTSLYLVHKELKKRTRPYYAHMLIGLTILLCSFAIYVGRDLRLSSWDVVIDPAGILFGISQSFVDFYRNKQVATITLTFFVFLGSLYTAAYVGILHLPKSTNLAKRKV